MFSYMQDTGMILYNNTHELLSACMERKRERELRLVDPEWLGRISLLRLEISENARVKPTMRYSIWVVWIVNVPR